MEECPNCKTWTLAYDPRAEMKMCRTCGYVTKVTFEAFVEQKNVINYLSYPWNRTIENAKQIICVVQTKPK